MASEAFKALDYNRQCLLVGKVKSMYDAGYVVQDIANQLHVSIELTEEIIEMIETAEKFKEEESE